MKLSKSKKASRNIKFPGHFFPYGKKAVGVDDFLPLMFTIFIFLIASTILAASEITKTKTIESHINTMVEQTIQTDNFIIFLDTPIKKFGPILEQELTTVLDKAEFDRLAAQNTTITDLIYLIDGKSREDPQTKILQQIVLKNKCDLALEGAISKVIQFKQGSAKVILPYPKDPEKVVIVKGRCQ